MATRVLPRLAVPVSERDHVLGLATAPLTLVEYGDYECPSSGKVYPVVEALRLRFGGRDVTVIVERST